METIRQLGEKLKKAIFDKGYQSVELFAHHHDIHKGTLSKILNGRTNPKFTTLSKLAEALDLPDAFFFSPQGLGMEVREPKKKYKVGGSLIKTPKSAKKKSK